MLDKKNLLQLAKIVANANPSNPAAAYSYEGENFTYDRINETLRNELNEYAGDYKSLRNNAPIVYSIIEEIIDDVLPKKLSDIYADIAEVKVIGQGEKAQFRRKLNRKNRAKQFITRVGLAGRYEVFKLGAAEEVFEVPTSAVGGAVQIGLEEFLDGRVDFNELIDIVIEGMNDLIYAEAAASLEAGVTQLPENNSIASPGFNEAAFDKLITIASAYGIPTIYCTHEFAVTMNPSTADWLSDKMKEELYYNGRLMNYKGTKVVILPQSFTNELNNEKVVDPSRAWIIPTGANQKPIKIVVEGDTIVEEFKNRDFSRELQTYKKVGVTAMLTNDICTYKNTSLTSTFDSDASLH